MSGKCSYMSKGERKYYPCGGLANPLYMVFSCREHTLALDEARSGTHTSTFNCTQSDDTDHLSLFPP